MEPCDTEKLADNLRSMSFDPYEADHDVYLNIHDKCEIITLPKLLAAFFPTSCTVTYLVSQSQEGGYLLTPGLSHSE